MNAYILQFCSGLKELVKRSKYKASVEKVETFLEREPSLKTFRSQIVIELLYLEAYAAHKIGYMQATDQQDRFQPEISNIMLAIMVRNFNIMEKIFNDFLNHKQVIVHEHAEEYFSNFQSDYPEQFFQKFLQVGLWLVKDFALIYEIRHESISKETILEAGIKFMKISENCLVKKKISHTIQQLEIHCFYAVTLFRNANFKKSCITFENNSIIIFNYLSFLSLKERTDGNSTFKMKKLKRYIKRCSKLLMLSLVYLAISHIFVNQLKSVFSLLSIITRMEQISGVRELLKYYSSYSEILVLMKNASEEQEELGKIARDLLSSLMNNLKQSTITQQEQLYETEIMNPLIEQKPKTINRPSLNLKNTRSMVLVYNTYDTVLENNTNNKYIKNITKQLVAKKKDLLFANDDEKESSLNKCFVKAIDRINKTDFSQNQNMRKSSSSVFRATFLKYKISLDGSKEKKELERVSERHRYITTKKCQNLKVLEQSVIQERKKELKRKQFRKTENWRDLEDEYEQEYPRAYERELMKRKSVVFSLHCESESEKKVGAIYNKGDKLLEGQAAVSEATNLEKFIKLLIKNKKVLSITEYCCKIEAYLKRDEAKKNEKINPRSITTKSRIQSTKLLRAQSNEQNQAKSAKPSILLRLKSSNNYPRTKNSDQDNLVSSILQIATNNANNKKMIQSQEESKQKLQKKLEQCYRKSFESVEELLKKVRYQDKSKKLTKKPQNLYTGTNHML